MSQNCAKIANFDGKIIHVGKFCAKCFFVPYIYVADRPYNPEQDKDRKIATTKKLMSLKAEVSFIGSGR
jgi:hypothetical protein